MNRRTIVLLTGGIVFLLFFLMGAYNGFQETLQKEESKATQTPQEQIISRIATTSFPDRTVEVAVNGESALKALQQAIDSCSLAGGGKVVVKAGHYALDGPLKLKSNVNLHLQEGAYLQFSGRADDFLPVVLTRWEGTELYGHSPMVYAYHCTNIAITGKGVIDAQGGKEFAPWATQEARKFNF